MEYLVDSVMSRDFLSGNVLERLCSSLDFCPIRAPSPQRAGLLLDDPESQKADALESWRAFVEDENS